ncbi:hypothetical protein ACH5RR_030030 [Cinchona calisaya]|uniref:Glucan endo-1,3-beta-D-glucosidase n=1 Tax=Cinchona calisaya TaxID=153742 RepID=A0ABD2YTD9_9GENT
MAQQIVDIGVCYGTVADNLPLATDAINLYKKYGVHKLRLFDPNHDVLQALSATASGIIVTLGVKNQDIPNIAASIEGATSWFTTNVEPYLNNVAIHYISVGNEAIPGEFASSILPAIQNLQAIFDDRQLDQLFLTTTVATTVLGVSYPPSASIFSPEVRGTIVDILKFLSTKEYLPLMINAYPYFAYASDPTNVRLDYVLFTATEPVVVDGDLKYTNLFDAIVDSFYWAMEKEGITNVEVGVTESGWPSAGNGNFTTKELASTYNKNFVNHIVSKIGTPKRPGAYIEGFIFALFNENQKPDGIERNWGLFYPDLSPVYPVFQSFNRS